MSDVPLFGMDTMEKFHKLMDEIMKSYTSIEATKKQVQLYVALWECEKLGVFKDGRKKNDLSPLQPPVKDVQ